MEFARRVAGELGLDAGLLEGVSTAALGQVAARPLAAGLGTEKLRRMYPGLRMRTVAESIADCRAELLGMGAV
jgi:dTDP-4-dehydrorhamnose reductase